MILFILTSNIAVHYIQTTVLHQAMTAFPASTNWWIKGDAVDLVAGLGESVKGEWSGDVDIGDGRLQQTFKDYQKRLQMIAKMDRRESSVIAADLKQEFALLGDDMEFLLESMLCIILRLGSWVMVAVHCRAAANNKGV